jgi:hypothetical protein
VNEYTRHRDHVAEDEGPEEEAGDVAVTFATEVLERAAGVAGAERDAGVRTGGDRGEETTEHEAPEREVSGKRHGHPEDADDPAADHAADRHRGGVGGAELRVLPRHARRLGTDAKHRPDARKRPVPSRSLILDP